MYARFEEVDKDRGGIKDSGQVSPLQNQKTGWLH